MIETAYTGWLWFFALFFVSCCTGLMLASYAPWSSSARRVGIPNAFGLALSPFLLGFSVILSMVIFPKNDSETHLLFVLVLLSLPIVFFQFIKVRPVFLVGNVFTSKIDWVFVLLLLLYSFVLLFNTIFIPLTQNDALEYATVGRILFESKSLAAYPVLHPELSSSGFYGPWTHPPLYPALIYISYVLQGHAKFPGLMRAISPWCLLTSTLVIYRVGCLSNVTTGLLSALFFISTPLLFLGADSSLIDALPVLGMSLLIASIVGFEKFTMCGAIYQGVVLGLSLWTHSEAILFIPLFLVMLAVNMGFTAWQKFLKQSTIIIVTTICVGSSPYIHNFNLLGSVVSDKPIIFAIPELAWDEYFQVSRGIESIVERIQYGLLKGLFVLEAYSLVFWVMLASIILYFYVNRKNLRNATEGWLLPILGLIVLYLLGTLVSMLLGIDLMIRNERYWLVIFPGVSLFAGWGVAHILKGYSFSLKFNVRKAALVLTMIVCVGYFGLQLLGLSWYRIESAVNLGPRLEENFSNNLMSNPEISVVNYLREKTPKDSLVFSLKPADMYYSERRMLSYLDPHLVSFYRSRSKIKGWKMLHELGVNYVHVTDYYLPPMYHSVLQSILADNQLTELVYSADGNQIYKLLDHKKSNDYATKQVFNFTPGNFAWYQSTGLILGGRKNLGVFSEVPTLFKQTVVEEHENRLPLFQRDWFTSLKSGTTEFLNKDSHCIAVRGMVEYLLELNLHGHAYVKVFLTQYDEKGRLIKSDLAQSKLKVLVGDFILTRRHPNALFQRRFLTLPTAKCINVEVVRRGLSTLEIRQALLKSNQRANIE